MEHWLLSVRDLCECGLSVGSKPSPGAVSRPRAPPEPCELVLPEEMLDTEIIDCGRLLRHSSDTGPTMEFLKRGAAAKER